MSSHAQESGPSSSQAARGELPRRQFTAEHLISSIPPPGSHTHTHTQTGRQAGKCRYKDVIKMSTSLFHTIYHPLSPRERRVASSWLSSSLSVASSPASAQPGVATAGRMQSHCRKKYAISQNFNCLKSWEMYAFYEAFYSC